jgi:rubrerythrin
MAKAAKIGMNHTGIEMSPKDTKSLMDAVNEVLPDIPGNESGLANERSLRAVEADRVGSVPFPGNVKGMAKTAMDKLIGKSPELLIDKLGERLAYERNGVRLYEAALAKAVALSSSGSDLVAVLKHIHDEEAEHMQIVKAAIETLGADPTAQTPCADVSGVMSMGIMQVLADPRTNIPQCLEALLMVELADNAAWELLIELAEQAGHPNIAESFGKALKQEEDHLVKIKSHLRKELIIQIQ